MPIPIAISTHAAIRPTVVIAPCLTLDECPHIAVSTRFIDEALARAVRRFPKPRGP